MLPVACVLSLLLLGAVSGAVSGDGPTVQTLSGVVQGVVEVQNNSLTRNAFYGIPYASAPVGLLRWQPPQPVPKWSGVKQATNYGSMCYQFGSIIDDSYQSEDCLFLNVFTPSLPNATNTLLPVLVFLHGGSLIFGAANYSRFDGLSVDGNVVIVTLNYRLNAFGFLALRELSSNDPRGVSGNYGLMDQQFALQWVQDNIEFFGGNKSQVGLMGQSSGGTSVLALLSSPQSKGLFSAAISLSGSPNITMDLGTGERQNREFVDNSNCSSASSVLSCLYDLTPEQVVAAIPANWNFLPAICPDINGCQYPGIVLVDGITVPLPLLEALAAPVIDVPFIISSLAQENEFFINQTQASITSTMMVEYIYDTFSPWPQRLADIINTVYVQYSDPYVQTELTTLQSDVGINCATTQLATIAANSFSSPVYLAYVQAPPQNAPFNCFTPLYNSFHLWDLIAAAEIYDFCAVYGGGVYQPGENDILLGKSLRNDWVSLAQNGRVQSSGWQTVNDAHSFPTNLVTGVIGEGGAVTSAMNFRSNVCYLFDKFNITQPFWWCN